MVATKSEAIGGDWRRLEGQKYVFIAAEKSVLEYGSNKIGGDCDQTTNVVSLLKRNTWPAAHGGRTGGAIN